MTAASRAAVAERLERTSLLERLRRSLSPWRLAVAVSALLLLAVAAAAAVSWAVTSGTRSTSYIAAAEVLRVELDVGDGSVVVHGGGQEEVAVRRTDHFAFGHSPSEWRTLDSGVLRITATCPSLVVGSCASDYDVTVSDNVPVAVRVEHGNVRLVGYRGSADLETRGGSVAVDGFCGFVLQAATRQGSIDVRTACSAERMELRADSGDVTAAVPAGRYRMDVATNGGRSDVRGVVAADDAPWSIQALSNTGNVTVVGDR